MTTPDDHDPASATRGEDATLAAGFREARKPRWERRREKIRNEIERNRRGDYKIPTWVLAALLVAIVVAWAAVIIFG